MKKRLLAGIMSLLMAVSAIGIGLSAVAANDDGYTSFRLTDLPNQNYKYYSTLYGDCLNVGNASGGGYHILWKNGSTNHRIPLGKTLAINNLSLKFNNFKLLNLIVNFLLKIRCYYLPRINAFQINLVFVCQYL